MAKRGSAVQQAGAVPYRRTELGGVEVLLVSRRSGGWGFPKGRIERGSDAGATARAETLEEAGVLGALREPALGRYAFHKRGRRHEAQLFPLAVTRVLGRWPEEGRRARVWVPIAEAPALLRGHASTRLVERLRHRLLVEESNRLTAGAPQVARQAA